MTCTISTDTTLNYGGRLPKMVVSRGRVFGLFHTYPGWG